MIQSERIQYTLFFYCEAISNVMDDEEKDIWAAIHQLQRWRAEVDVKLNLWEKVLIAIFGTVFIAIITAIMNLVLR